MQLRYHLVGPLFAQCIGVAHATSVGLNSLQTQTTNAADLASFGEQVGLSESTIQTLGEKFAQVRVWKMLKPSYSVFDIISLDSKSEGTRFCLDLRRISKAAQVKGSTLTES